MDMKDQPELMTLQEAAAYLRLSPATLYQRRYRGDPPTGHRIGNRIVYRRTELDHYVDHGRDPEPAR